MTTLANLIAEQSAARPTDVAFVDGARSHTYASLDGASASVASALTGSGVRSGDRVAYLGRNALEFFEFLFGAAKLGAVPIALNWRLAPREVVEILTDSGARTLLVDQALTGVRDEISGRLADELLILQLGPDGDYESWRDRAPACLEVSNEHTDDDVALQLYTSGTTGSPKGVLLTHRNWNAAVDSHRAAIDLDENGMQLLALPLFHIGGLMMALLSVRVGATSVLLPDAEPQRILDAVQAHAVTHLPSVPALLGGCLALAKQAGMALPSLRTVIYGAAPMPESLLRTAMSALHAHFVSGYGMTETTATVIFLGADDHRLPEGGDAARRAIRRLGSVGRVDEFAKIKIVDPQTLAERKPGEHGEILIGGRQVMKGYWRRPCETRDTLLAGGWLRTGDSGYLDEDGYLFLNDRIKDMIISGGENIYAAELENTLSAMPGIREVAVIGVPDQRWGETPKALIVREAQAQLCEQDVIAYCRANLARFKCPTSVEWLEDLPRTPSGKVTKYLLRERYRDAGSSIGERQHD